MPSNGQLTWAEFRDFSPGVWERGDWLVPAGGAQELMDLYPQKGGGLRAFFKPTTLATTGMSGLGSDEKITGLFGYFTNHRTTAGAKATDFYCVTYKTSTNTNRFYRWDQTDSAQTQWTLITGPISGTATAGHAHFMSYVLASGQVDIVVSTGNGIYRMQQSLVTAVGSFNQIGATAGLYTPMTVHQNRLVYADGSKVWFSGPGDETISASNFVDVEPQRNFSRIITLLPNAPGDLLIGYEGAGWAAIQGELTDPIIRTMSEAHTPGIFQGVADTGHGVAFIEAGSGIYLTSDGSSFQRLDEQLLPLPTTGGPVLSTIGELTFLHHWLFARGRVWDEETKSWFRTSYTYNDPAFVQWADKAGRKVGAVANLSQVIYLYDINESTGTRVNTGTWKSPSLRSPDGRQIVIREVQLSLRSYVNTSSVTVTINGVAYGSGSLDVGRQTIRTLTAERGEVLDITVAVTSGDTSHEAPSIEVVRVGSRAGGHLTPSFHF